MVYICLVSAPSKGGESSFKRLSPFWTAIGYGLLCAALFFSWQFLKVRSEFGGNWTGLFDTGRDFPTPPQLASEKIVVVSETTGYDGQFYHYVAHDPFFRRGLAQYIDRPRLRYGRILVPAAAYLLAAGNQAWIDFAYRAVVLFFVFLGAYWMARYVLQHRQRSDITLLFILFPATILSMETLTVDVALMALCAGFLLWQKEPSWKLAAILALAPLVRETGAVLIAAAVLSSILRKKWAQAGLFACTVLPWLAWSLFVYRHTQAQPYPISFIPFSETVRALLHSRSAVPPPMGAIVTFLDRLTIAGSVIAILAGLWQIRRKESVALAAAGFALLGIVLQRGDVWENYHAHTRVLSPLYLWLITSAAVRPRSIASLPLWLVIPRFALQLLAQIPGFF